MGLYLLEIEPIEGGSMMRDFFNKYCNVSNILKEKREYKEQMKRLEALPEEYRYTFDKIQNYMWSFATGDAMDILHIHYELLDLFEESAANGRRVLEVTGKDVAGFADELLKNATTYTDKNREKLNREIAKKVGK